MPYLCLDIKEDRGVHSVCGGEQQKQASATPEKREAAQAGFSQRLF
jgi:hypothetical protein